MVMVKHDFVGVITVKRVSAPEKENARVTRACGVLRVRFICSHREHIHTSSAA